MVDEDFVLGYVTGYNDGVGSGGSGGVPEDMTFIKKYQLVGTDFQAAAMAAVHLKTQAALFFPVQHELPVEQNFLMFRERAHRKPDHQLRDREPAGVFQLRPDLKGLSPQNSGFRDSNLHLHLSGQPEYLTEGRKGNHQLKAQQEIHKIVFQ